VMHIGSRHDHAYRRKLLIASPLRRDGIGCPRVMTPEAATGMIVDRPRRAN
jgi:hypothetical protein